MLALAVPRWHQGSVRPLNLLRLAVLAALSGLPGCARDHVIGVHCGPGTSQPVCAGSDGGTDAGAGDAGVIMDPPRECPLVDGCDDMTLVVGLDASGPYWLPQAFSVGAATLPVSLRLHGEDAQPAAWPARVGGTLSGAGNATTALPTLFTDASRRVRLPAATAYTGGATIGAAGTGDFVLEVVFRADPGVMLARKLAGGQGYALGTDAQGALRLTLSDGSLTVDVVSEALVVGAWHHCVAYVSPGRTDARGARVDCNGRPGAFTDVRALGDVDTDAPLTLGGGAEGELLFLALHRAPSVLATLPDPDAALGVASRTRFAMLTGTWPYLAQGTPLPATQQRSSAAWLDMLDAGGTRRLFLVGRDWPRVVCRPAGAARFCAYLAEGEPTRAYGDDISAASFGATELTVSAGAALFADGTTSMEGLVPSTTSGAHTLARSRAYGGQPLAFSFFARAGTSGFVGVSAGALGVAVFDLGNGTVVTPPDVQAHIEDFGGGLFRCAYVATPPAGSVEHRLHLLADGALAAFAGDGVSASVFVAGLQIEIGEALPTSLAPPGNRSVDRLTFLGTDGNLDPLGAGVVAEVRLAALPRVTDHAIVNLSRLGTFDDEINVFLAGASGQFAFGARADAAGVWGFQNPTSGIDGETHALRVAYDASGLELTVDGESSFFVPGGGVVIPSALDRMDIGHSGDASGPLEGLVRRVGFSTRSPQ